MKNIINLVLVVSTTFLLGGCATNYGAQPSDVVSSAVEIKNSEFDRNIVFVGPPILTETNRGVFTDNETTRLVGVKNKITNEITYHVYVSVLYSFDWRFYNTVSLLGGSVIDVKRISQQVKSCTSIGCIHFEEFSFPISKINLTQPQGLQFRANGSNGFENKITIPPQYVSGFLFNVSSR